MATSATSSSATAKSPVKPPAEHRITHLALLEYLANAAVNELVIVEFDRGSYRIEVSLSWKDGKSALMAARGEPRVFRSLDTLIRFLKSANVGRTVVRLELMA